MPYLKIACKYKRQLKHHPTPAESKFVEILKKYKIPYSFQKIICVGHRFFIIDFKIIMKPWTLIEIDGDSHTKNEEYDNNRTKLILTTRKYKKYKLIRIKNEEVFNGKALEILKTLYKRKFNN